MVEKWVFKQCTINIYNGVRLRKCYNKCSRGWIQIFWREGKFWCIYVESYPGKLSTLNIDQNVWRKRDERSKIYLEWNQNICMILYIYVVKKVNKNIFKAGTSVNLDTLWFGKLHVVHYCLTFKPCTKRFKYKREPTSPSISDLINLNI